MVAKMDLRNVKLLVVGAGSIGSRHIRNLNSLGVSSVIVCDSRPDQLAKIQQTCLINGVYTDLEVALQQKVDGVIVCTPTSSHAVVALEAAKKGYHVFVEKPLSDTLMHVDELIRVASENNKVLMVGFNLRFHPCLQQIKSLLVTGKIGKIISARVEFGQYLPDWRPTQDYRKSYSAQKSLGGGIIMDAIHELDYISWFLGDVSEVFSYAGKLSDLELDTEDTAEILLKFKSNALGSVHMDYVQRTYNRQCEIIGDQGTITWNFNDSAVKLYTAQTGKWRTYSIGDGITKFDFNQTYLKEIAWFLDCITSDRTPLVDGVEGKRIQELAIAVKVSAETGKVIRL